MDQTFKLQMDIKNNAEDLRKYVMDLRSWEEEMKEKEKSLQSEKSDVKVCHFFSIKKFDKCKRNCMST